MIIWLAQFESRILQLRNTRRFNDGDALLLSVIRPHLYGWKRVFVERPEAFGKDTERFPWNFYKEVVVCFFFFFHLSSL